MHEFSPFILVSACCVFFNSLFLNFDRSSSLNFRVKKVVVIQNEFILVLSRLQEPGSFERGKLFLIFQHKFS